jgi:hypothetical protein
MSSRRRSGDGHRPDCGTAAMRRPPRRLSPRIRAAAGHRGVVAPAVGVEPLPRHRVAVAAEHAAEVGRRALLSGPDRQGVAVEVVYVVQRVALVVVEAARDLLARRGVGERVVQVADHLHPGDSLPVLHQVHALEQEEAPAHPLIGHGAHSTARDLPGPDQPIQRLHLRAGLRRLRCTFGRTHRELLLVRIVFRASPAPRVKSNAGRTATGRCWSTRRRQA